MFDFLLSKLFGKKKETSLVELISEINPESLREIYSYNVSNRKVRCLFKNVIEFIRHIDQVFFVLQNGGLVPECLNSENPHVVNIIDFFTHDGFYVDPVETTRRLKESCLQLIHIYSLEDGDIYGSGLRYKNHLRLSALINNIQLVFEDIHV